MTLTPEMVTALQALEQQATKGPWSTHRIWPRQIVPQADADRPVGGASSPERDNDYARVIAEVKLFETKFDGWEQYTRRQFDAPKAAIDAKLIAAMRNALPALLASASTLAQIQAILTAWRPMDLDVMTAQEVVDFLLKLLPAPAETGR